MRGHSGARVHSTEEAYGAPVDSVVPGGETSVPPLRQSIETPPLENGMASMKSEQVRTAMSNHRRFDERKKGVQSSVKLRHRGISKYLYATESKDNLLDSGMSAIFGTEIQNREQHWVDSNLAKSLFCSAIVLNAIFIGVDASLDEPDIVDGQGSWTMTLTTLFIFEIIFLLLFMWEVFLRMQAEGWAFFKDSWNVFDSSILLVTIADISVSFAEHFISLHSAKDDFKHIAKTFRIGRVLRLLRLFRFVQELNLILSGMGASLLKLFWCLSLLFMTIYMAAIFALRYIGQADHLKGDEVIASTFGTLGRCMFTLFTFVTLEGFPDVTMYLMRPEILGAPIAVGVVAFIIFTNLAVLNLVAAVVLESIMVAAEKDQRKRQARLERERAHAVQRLAKVFGSIHGIDHHAGLALSDFKQAVAEHPELQAELSRLDVLSQDVDELFHLMDFDGDGTLSVHEFVEGLLRMQAGNASAKHVMSLQYDLQHMWNVLGQGQDALSEGQLFLRNDLRSGQRQLARRIEQKIDKTMGLVSQTVTQTLHLGSDEAETPTGSFPLLQRQSKEDLTGWQWRGGEKIHATAGSDADAVDPRGRPYGGVDQLTEKISRVVQESVLEAAEQVERRLMEWLEAKQVPVVQSDSKTLSDVLAMLEELPRKMQQELSRTEAAALQTTSTHSELSCEHAREEMCELVRLERMASAETCMLGHREPQYSIRSPPPLDTVMSGEVTPAPTPCAKAGIDEMFHPRSAGLAVEEMHRGADYLKELSGTAEQQRGRAAQPREPHSARAPGVARSVSPWDGHHSDGIRFGSGSAPVTSRCHVPDSRDARYLECRYDPVDGRLWNGDAHLPWHGRQLQAGSLHGSPCRRDLYPRLQNVKKWAVERGLANTPFDKLVMHLDSLGVQLSIPEQDALKELMQSGPLAETLGLPIADA